MRIEFKLDEWDDIYEKIMDEYPDAGSYYTIRLKGCNEFGVQHLRIVIPEYDISTRYGMERIDEDEYEEIFAFYAADEKRPSKVDSIYSNVYWVSAIGMLAPEGASKNPDCYVETDELIGKPRKE